MLTKSFAEVEEYFFGVDRANPEVKRLLNSSKNLNTISPPPDLAKSCSELKQSDLSNLYSNPSIGHNGETLVPRFRLVQDAIQKKMDSFKDELREKLKKHLPQCEAKIVDVPMLFAGNYDSQEKSVTGAKSLFPNPTNGLMVEKTYIIPSAGNKSIQKAMETIYKKLGVDMKSIDTYFAHAASGNLHCSTHLLRYCRPRN